MVDDVIAVMAVLLIFSRSHLPRDNEGSTPLHKAAFSGCSTCLQLVSSHSHSHSHSHSGSLSFSFLFEMLQFIALNCFIFVIVAQ
jgi:hypothetical protein